MKNKSSEIMLNTTIIYIDGTKEQYEALRRTEKGIIIGRILERKFVDCGFISKRNIKQIKNGGKMKG
jgi:hypothetical protein